MDSLDIQRQNFKELVAKISYKKINWNGICVHCNKSSDIAEYSLKKHYYICKKCKSNKLKTVYLNNKEKFKDQAGKRFKKCYKNGNTNFLATTVLARHRYNDKRRGFIQIYDFTNKEFLEFIKNPCYYCGDNNGIKTLDRKDNNLGHTKNNCVVACYICNETRWDNFTVEEMLEIGKIVKQIKRKRKCRV